MTIDRTAQPHSVASLLKAVDAAELGLPEFQRDFIWSPGDIVKLLQTVARQWPCGTFLLQEGPQPFACKPLDGAPSLRERTKLLILDGQQRLTGLYHAIREKGRETYFVDVKRLLETEILDDDHVRYLRADRYRANYPSLVDEASSLVVRVATLTRDSEFFTWTNYLSERDRTAVIRLRDEQLGGFKHYSIPCVVLDADLPLAAVARIFETLNRTGVRLDTFDLMVAKLYPFDFHLRDEWATALAKYPETLSRYEVPGLDVLKLISLREHLRQVASHVAPVTVKGVRESDVIALKPEVVKSTWDDALVAYDRALTFLRDECGVISRIVLPATAMVLPLAHSLAGKPNQNRSARLRRWFWSSCALQSYAQGANTQCVRDAKELLAWEQDSETVPGSVASLERIDEQTLIDARRRNEILLRAMLCAIIADGGKDWLSGERVSATTEVLDLHRLSLPSESKEDAVVDYVLLAQSTHRALGDVARSDLPGRVDGDVLKPHLIPIAELAKPLSEFRSARARLVATALSRLASADLS